MKVPGSRTAPYSREVPSNLVLMPDNPPKISAVIVPKNEEATIRRCVSSVLDQSVSVHEIIVVDGNSIDHTARYVSDLARQYDEINLISEDSHGPDSGPAAARNTGAALATGDMLLFLNGDVTIGPDYASRLLNLMSEQDLDAVSGLRWNVRNLFKAVRFAALSVFTWHAILVSGEPERSRSTEDGTL